MKLKLLPFPENPGYYERIVPDAGVREETMECDGWTRSYKIYVPSSWTGEKPVPLVISMHGGASHNADYRTTWPLVAEREGFVALFPQCIAEGETWNTWDTYTRKDGKPAEIPYLDTLIEATIRKYNIDRERIYIHGQSMGDSMTTWYAFERGYLFAAAAPFSGHTPPSRFVGRDGEIITKPKYELPVIRTHGSEDMNLIIGAKNIPTADPGKRASKAPALTNVDPASITDAMRLQQIELYHLMHTKVWTEQNGCEKLPRLTLNGPYAVYRFPGNPCDFIYYTVQGGYHATFLDMADYIWTYFFSGYRRAGACADPASGDRVPQDASHSGRIVKVRPEKAFDEDKGAVALADGSAWLYVDNQKLRMPEGTCRMLEGVPYVPVSALPLCLPGLEYEMLFEGEGAELYYGGDRVQIAKNHRAVVRNEEIVDIGARVYLLDGLLYAPVGALADLLAGRKCAAGFGAAYINDRGGVMSYDLSYVIGRILGTVHGSTPLECLRQELVLEGADVSGLEEKYGHWGAGRKMHE